MDGLDFPAGIAFTSDGNMIVTERPGRVRLVEDGRLRERPLAEIPTTTAGEAGLLGVAVDPNDEAVFVFATESDGSTNTIWRVPLTGSGDAQRVVTDLPASTYHNGGGVAFDRDGMLLVSNGEQHSSARAQDPGSLGGKVYRFTPDGDVPQDNPFGGSPALAIGLRNPFGLAVDPETGEAWVTENGPESWDEVNRVPKGGNLGWPVISGPRDGGERGPGSLGPGDYVDPVLSFEQIIVPTGIAFAGEGSPVRHRDALFFAAYGDSTIRRAVLDEERAGIVRDEVFLRDEAPVVALAWGPRGLYFSTAAGAVKVVTLSRQQEASPTPEEASPAETAVGSGPREEPAEDGERPWWVVLLVLLLAGGYLVTRRRLLR